MSDKNEQGNRFTRGLKGVGSGIVNGMNALAEAEQARQRREAAAAENERIERAAVEDQISEYERSVGRPFYRTGVTEIPQAGVFFAEGFSQPFIQLPGQSTLPWDLANKGHLINCKENCRTDHCLVCGQENYGRTYCTTHRP